MDLQQEGLGRLVKNVESDWVRLWHYTVGSNL